MTYILQSKCTDEEFRSICIDEGTINPLKKTMTYILQSKCKDEVFHSSPLSIRDSGRTPVPDILLHKGGWNSPEVQTGFR
jgi:hypothetical protein